MRLEPKNKDRLSAVVLGKEKADLAIENVRFVNVFTGEVYPAVVYTCGAFVAYVAHGERLADRALANEIIDGGDRYLVPGFIDAHVHIESSMLTPRGFAEITLPRGTTSVITDPHEMANVLGEAGVRYMHDAAEELPQRQFVDIPSCVPAVPEVESSGARFDADTIRRLATLDRALGLAEVMDFMGVANNEPRMRGIIDAARECGLYIQGHLVSEDGRIIAAYAAGGGATCHENHSGCSALAKMRNGMTVDARDSSITKNVADIVEGLKGIRWLDRLCMCTDDREADDIMRNGHIDCIINSAIRAGLNPIDAIRCATFNNAREANLENLGAIAPGYAADMVLVRDLDNVVADTVIVGGKVVAESGRLCTPLSPVSSSAPNVMRAPKLGLRDFGLAAPSYGESFDVNIMAYRSLDTALTDLEVVKLSACGGKVDISGDDGLCYVTIVNRYGAGTIAQGIVRDFGLKRGANASTVSHDSHNITVVYKDAESALAVYNALVACGGGMACCVGGETTVLELPFGGLMSDLPAEQVSERAQILKAALFAAGLETENPILRIATLALPVIPNVKFTDRGLADVFNKRIIEPFPSVFFN